MPTNSYSYLVVASLFTSIACGAPAPHRANIGNVSRVAISAPNPEPTLADAKVEQDALKGVLLFDTEDDGPFHRVTVEKSGLSPTAVARLVTSAEQSQTDSLVLLSQGRLVVHREFGDNNALQLRSVTKLFTGLAVGMLRAEGKIATLDTPVFTWFAEWNDGTRNGVTLRHILSHTSGIAHAYGDKTLYAQKDTLAYVRGHSVDSSPGVRFSYNNDAVQLLSGIISAVSGRQVDEYLREVLFRPLSIENVVWGRDATGNAFTYAGLALRGLDLAKVGVVMLEEGAWHGVSVVPSDWLKESRQPQIEPTVGLLTQLFYGDYAYTLAEPGLERVRDKTPSLASALQDLHGQKFVSLPEAWMRLGSVLSRSQQKELTGVIAGEVNLFARESVRGLVGFGHTGSMGQYFVMLPEKGIVGVRLIDYKEPPPMDVDFERLFKDLAL